MGDEIVSVDTSGIRKSSEAMGRAAELAGRLAGKLHAVPDPAQASGTGSDRLSQAFLSNYQQMGGGDLEPQLAGLGKGLNALADNLTGVAADFERADEVAGGQAGGARTVVDADLSGP
jgi:hypothetical protein